VQYSSGELRTLLTVWGGLFKGYLVSQKRLQIEL
jgi:hypothetical protein